MRRFAPLLPLLLLALPPAPLAASAAAVPARRASSADTAVFAGGCFWCMETQFRGLKGVSSVVSGYTGGHKSRPTYEQVSAHLTGHYEAVQVAFDPRVIPYEKLLERFWYSIDPTQEDGQFSDRGESYRTAIFTRGTAQRRAAEASKAALERSRVLPGPVVTRILDAGPFWPAEDYHQEFWRKNPDHYRSYRAGSGRDRRLSDLWGKAAAKPLVH